MVIFKLLKLLCLSSSLCWCTCGGASVGTTDAEALSSPATTTTTKPPQHAKEGLADGDYYFAQRTCESEMKTVTKDVTDLRLQLQTMQLQQDLISMRTQLRDLQQRVANDQNPVLSAQDSSPGFAGQSPQGAGFQRVLSDETRSSTDVDAEQSSNAEAIEQKNRTENDVSDTGTVKTEGRSSSVYVRWGAGACPDTAKLVYSGVVGGGLYTDKGAAVNALCLPLNPVYDNQQPTEWNTVLYGAEYDTLPSSEQDLDVLCAVCEIPRPLTLMVPATNACHPGWTLEYSGYLMAGKEYHAASTEYLCVDAAREGRVGSKANHNGKLFYFTLGKCGSLPCPPYEEGRVLLCAVCSK